MHKKNIIISSILAIIISLGFGYGLVFANFSELTLKYISNTNIYNDSVDINKTNIILKSKNDISNLKFLSSCKTFTKFLEKKDNNYLFELKYFPGKCENPNIYLKNEKGEVFFKQYIKVISQYDILSRLLDLDTNSLETILKNIKIKEQKSLGFKLKELLYTKNILENILKSRSEKYSVPVEGYSMPTKLSKIPNAGRPYRKSYTDGIHHGWDVGHKLGEKVIALDDGIIIRVVSDFEFYDLNKIKHGNNLSYDEKLRNLDILRGNQVWLKTSRGDVVFYSHLKDVNSSMKVGSTINKGDLIGTIGISGVPDKNYTDYHLHFTIHKNPYNISKAGKYDIDDYMKWDWYFKGQSNAAIFKGQKELFDY